MTDPRLSSVNGPDMLRVVELDEVVVVGPEVVDRKVATAEVRLQVVEVTVPAGSVGDRVVQALMMHGQRRGGRVRLGQRESDLAPPLLRKVPRQSQQVWRTPLQHDVPRPDVVVVPEIETPAAGHGVDVDTSKPLGGALTVCQRLPSILDRRQQRNVDLDFSMGLVGMADYRRCLHALIVPRAVGSVRFSERITCRSDSSRARY